MNNFKILLANYSSSLLGWSTLALVLILSFIFHKDISVNQFSRDSLVGARVINSSVDKSSFNQIQNLKDLISKKTKH